MKEQLNLWLIDDDDAAHTYHKIMMEEAGLNKDRVQSFFCIDDAFNEIN